MECTRIFHGSLCSVLDIQQFAGSILKKFGFKSLKYKAATFLPLLLVLAGFQLNLS